MLHYGHGYEPSEEHWCNCSVQHGFLGPCSCRLRWSCLGLIPGVTFPSYDGLVLGPSDFMTVCLTQPSQWWKVPDAWSLGVPWSSFPSPLWPSGIREAAFQKAYNSLLQLTGSFSRILTACIEILPLALAINFTLGFFFPPQLSPPPPWVCRIIWLQTLLKAATWFIVQCSITRDGMCCLHNLKRPTKDFVSFLEKKDVRCVNLSLLK